MLIMMNFDLGAHWHIKIVSAKSSPGAYQTFQTEEKVELLHVHSIKNVDIHH